MTAGVYIRREGVLVPAATIPGPRGTIGPTGAKGDPGDQSPASSSTFGPTSTVLTEMAPVTKTRILAGNVTITSLSAGPANWAYTATFIFKQAASGGPYTVTWPATLEWANDAPAPPMPAVANAELMVHLFWTGTAWRGILGGVFFP